MQTLEEAMRAACDQVGIRVPRKTVPGVWAKSAVIGKASNNTSGRVLVFDDGRGGVAHNWATGMQVKFRIDGDSEAGQAPRPKVDHDRIRRMQEEQRQVEAICAEIVRACRQEPHPYLERKGFPEELGLVHDMPQKHFPLGRLGESLAKAMPEGEGPWLIIPGRIGKTITTVQFIAPDGTKKNILRGRMDGARHRIASGAETWIAEGIATALTVRAALRLLGRSATVLSAFSASNAAKVAAGIPGAFLAADHDKPVEQFDGLGTGEFYAKRSGQVYAIPPALGDFNDYHMSRSLRDVALILREVKAA